ncbi:DUF4178 domain-containing protein [Desulfonema ishimotonii]|uniref:DUF4178 domain-containing protein n=1 Tax=Desulfonema ishimotonii TaxID=45657 RepID=A0A401FWB6_9BACT|nr:DUF4178 domain-containing protein [Desulfonema ishimotonii]GBC61234.1 DUF4178 domain-containing protein [Desulfonema ishimotonii]
MGWKDLLGFGRKENPADKGPDPLHDLTLSGLQAGDMVDFDLKTWQVQARHRYDWGGGDISFEWQLKSHDDVIYLQKDADDEAEWSISRPIAFGRLGPEIRDYLSEHDDPPEEIVFDGVTYCIEEMAGGHFYKDDRGPGKEFLSWSYADDSGEKYLSIEQWGETEFEAAVGGPAEEYQFTNILPGSH